MDKKRIALLLLLFATIGIWLFINQKSSGQDIDQGAEPAEGISATDLDEEQKQAQNPTSAEGANSGFLPTEMAEPERFKLLQEEIQKMSECLEIQVDPLDPNEDINIATLNQSLQKDLGEALMEEEDWNSTDIRTSSGELRRILVTSRDADQRRERVVRYSAFREGQEVELGLSSEQTENPSETFLASLEKDGEVFAKSYAKKIFYASGDVLSVVEKDGKVFSWNISHNGKGFSCSDADGAKLKCQCQ